MCESLEHDGGIKSFDRINVDFHHLTREVADFIHGEEKTSAKIMNPAILGLLKS